MLSLPRPASGGAPTSPAWDPWLRPTSAPDPAPVQNVYREPPAHPPPSRPEAPKEKHKKRVTPPFLETTVCLLVLVAF